MNTITLPRSVVEQVLNWALNHGEKVYAAGGLKSIDSMNAWAEALRVALEQPDVRIPTSVPDGWKLVPVEPTRDMLTTWIKAPVVSNTTAPGLYRAMLAAAPQPPVVEQPQVEQEPVGEAGSMPGTDGFTMACFLASDVPVGTKLYTRPQTKREPLTEADLYDIASNYFADEWAQKQAVMMLKDHGIGGEE